MSMSFIAMNRLVEERAGEDEAYRRQLTRSRKCTLSDGRALPDEALLEKLRSLGLKEASRDWLDRFSRNCPSAQALATTVTKHSGLSVPADQLDWVWIALVCLWERWFPDRPNFELLDDWMQAGYEAQERDEPLETAQLWLRAWRGIEQLRTTFHIGSIEQFDEWFGGTQSVFNWVQDCSMALHHAALTDHSFEQERLAFCNAVLELAAKSERDKSLIGLFRQDLAQSHADLGQYETLDRLCTDWLRDDPQWGWGWIAWSDAYYTFAPEERSDPVRAEQILKDGLAVPNLRDREHVSERLADLYEETGRPTDAADVREQHGRPLDADRELNVEGTGSQATLNSEDFHQPIISVRPPAGDWDTDLEDEGPRPSDMTIVNTAHKIGRNEPCPCGSGKKYKKCCGAG